jgi:hypothetical protein
MVHHTRVLRAWRDRCHALASLGDTNQLRGAAAAMRCARTLRILRELDGIAFESLLEVGGGDGRLSHLIRSLFGVRAVSTDLSLEACLRARERFGVAAAAVQASSLPCVDNAFDAVVCNGIEGERYPVEAMLELQRVAARAVILVTEAVTGDLTDLTAELFVRPGWPQLQRNRFLGVDFLAAFPRARLLPILDVEGAKEPEPALLRDWLIANTRHVSFEQGGSGLAVISVRDGFARTRRLDDSRLVDCLLESSAVPVARSPHPPLAADFAHLLRSPYGGGCLELRDGVFTDGDGRDWVVRDGVPDFFDPDAPALSRERFAQRTQAMARSRRAALLEVRDRLDLHEPVGVADFDFRQVESRRGFWPNEQLEPRCSFDGIGFSWRSTAEDPWLATPRLHRRITAIELELRVFAPGVACEAGEGQVFWLGCGDFEFAEERSVRFSLRNDGEFHVYRVVLAAIPALPELVEWLRLDLANGPAEIDLRALRLR